MKRAVLTFVGERQVEVQQEEVAPPGPGELAVRTLVSAISTGTELLAYRGQLPSDLAVDETLPALAGNAFRFPFRYGYASVGEVTGLGSGVDPAWMGRRVFAFVPHASAFVAAEKECFALPEGLDPERAALLASQETAVNVVLDAAPGLGERVVLLGQGVVGLLVTAVLARFPLARLVAVEPDERRRALATAFGATAVATADEARALLGPGGADLALELSGNPAAVSPALALTGREGRVVLGSFYGSKTAPVDLGPHFHRGRLTVFSSQVSHIHPRLSGRWDRRRRFELAIDLLARENTHADLGRLFTHRLSLEEAPAAYRLLDSGGGAALQVLFTAPERGRA